MRNLKINGKDISQITEEKSFKLLRDGNYKEAYDLLLSLKTKNRHLDKVNFALGFICELGIIEGTNVKLAESYYAKAIEFGSIEAKVRMAMLAEKRKILDIDKAYNLYNEVIEYYKSHNENLAENDAKSLANNAAFAYYRLGRMYEKAKIVISEDPQENKLKAQEAYDLSLKLYDKYKINNIDKARVLSRTGWMRYTLLLEENNWNDASKIQKEVETIEKIFNQSNKLGDSLAKLGLLNIKALKCSLIEDGADRNIIEAKSYIKEALSIEPNDVPTLLLAARIETITLTSKDHKPALNYIRKAMEIAPSDKIVKKQFDEIIGFQSRNFAKSLEHQLKNYVQETIKNAAKKGAAQETINKSLKLQEIFYPTEYNSASWLIKQTYSQQSLDKYLEDNIVQFIVTLNKTINQNKLFRELYDPTDQENLTQKIVYSLLENETDTDLIKFIIKTKSNNQNGEDHLDQQLTNQFELFYHNKNKLKSENPLLSKEEHQWVSAQEEFIKLFCEKFINERNTIESIAKGKALPVNDNIDKAKYTSDRAMLLLTAPPFSYLGNVLGGSSWTYILTTLTTDFAHSKYKESIISSFVAVDKMLPKTEEANEVILNIAKEFAYKYSTQIANIKDQESLKLFAEVTLERMMSHAFAQTGIVKQIQDSINNKVNSALNFVLGNEKELNPIDARKLLYEGIWYGKSSSKEQRIRTHTEKREFSDNWEANELLVKTGIITQDKRIFGNIKNIEKYGCASGDEIDANIRNLQPINQAQLNLELKGKLKEASKKHEKMQPIVEQNTLHNTPKVDNVKFIENHKNYKTIFAKSIIGIGAAFLLLSLAVIYIPLLTALISIVPGFIAAGSLLTIGGIVFGRSTNIETQSESHIAKPKLEQTNEKDKEKEDIKVKVDKIKGPTPLDSYHEQTRTSTEKDKSHLAEKQSSFISRMPSNSTIR